MLGSTRTIATVWFSLHWTEKTRRQKLLFTLTPNVPSTFAMCKYLPPATDMATDKGFYSPTPRCWQEKSKFRQHYPWIRRQCYLSKSPSGVKLSGSIIVDNMTKRTTVIRTPFLRSKHMNTFILKYIYQYLELLKIEHDERKTGVSAQTKWLLQGELLPINSNNK